MVGYRLSVTLFGEDSSSVTGCPGCGFLNSEASAGGGLVCLELV